MIVEPENLHCQLLSRVQVQNSSDGTISIVDVEKDVRDVDEVHTRGHGECAAGPRLGHEFVQTEWFYGQRLHHHDPVCMSANMLSPLSNVAFFTFFAGS